MVKEVTTKLLHSAEFNLKIEFKERGMRRSLMDVYRMLKNVEQIFKGIPP